MGYLILSSVSKMPTIKIQSINPMGDSEGDSGQPLSSKWRRRDLRAYPLWRCVWSHLTERKEILLLFTTSKGKEQCSFVTLPKSLLIKQGGYLLIGRALGLRSLCRLQDVINNYFTLSRSTRGLWEPLRIVIGIDWVFGRLCWVLIKIWLKS